MAQRRCDTGARAKLPVWKKGKKRIQTPAKVFFIFSRAKMKPLLNRTTHAAPPPPPGRAREMALLEFREKKIPNPGVFFP